MSKKNYPKRDRNRAPVHPGKILRTTVFPELKETMGKSVDDVAHDIKVSRQSLYALMAEKRSLTPEMAIKLGHYLGNGPSIWLRMQSAHDIWNAEKKTDVSDIPKIDAA